MQVVGTVVMARNRMDGPTVLASDPRSTHEVRWEGRGDPSGGDVQYIPEEILKTPQFARALNLGIVEIINAEDNPELVAALTAQGERFRAHQERARSEALATIDIQANNDLVVLPCVGPSSKGQGDCGEDVAVPEKKKYDAPPLCHRHQQLAREFVPVHTGQDERENKEVKWVRGTLNPVPLANQIP